MSRSHRRWTAIDLGEHVPLPAGSYSRAVRAAGLLFVSGQVPREFETGRLLGEDIESQTRAVIANLARVLEAAGAGLEDVVALTVYLQEAGDWDYFNRVYRELFTEPYPSRTVVGADLRGVLVEVTATAVDPG
jgi:2-iminobutanoate/2-iminopropanoate deaminase